MQNMEELSGNGAGGRPTDRIMPFLWLHGEEEALIREGMARIFDSGIGAVCVESRPHPDFLGEKWWRDLDVVLDEAKNRHMKVWVLDDAHFPTGSCNGLITDDSPYGKVYLTHVRTDVAGPLTGNAFMVYLEPGERLLGVVMGRLDRRDPEALSEVRDITERVREGKVYADIPAGDWSVMVLKTTRRGSGRKNYINTIDRGAVRFFIDTVYEPHYAHCGAEFGGVFAGFFSDEPEIGNGAAEHGHHLRAGQPDIVLPWCSELEDTLRSAWKGRWAESLASLFARVGGEALSARNRMDFTDAVSRLYGKNFCGQIGDWCRGHGVEYIGHVIEDDGRHAQLGLGTAHYFRALWGQDMAGIDVVLQQLRPGLDDFCFHSVGGVNTYNGEFFHYGLAKLAASLAKLDPGKKGRALCEVFGAYGWAEGLKTMKWILDHMLVNGVNHFVPHAFTMKPFPDPDCPPHFYARGHNPQYPYFRLLMEYAGRVGSLISGGTSRVSAAVLYTAEQEWAGHVIQFEKAVKELSRGQIESCVVPTDALIKAPMENGVLRLNDGDTVPALVVCSGEWIGGAAADAVLRAHEAGIHVYVFGGPAPKILRTDGSVDEFPPQVLRVAEEGCLADALRKDGHFEISMDREEKWLRYYHYVREKTDLLLFFNESPAEEIDGVLTISGRAGSAVWYDPWTEESILCPEGEPLKLTLSPYEMKILVLDRGKGAVPPALPAREYASKQTISAEGWRISLREAGRQTETLPPQKCLGDLGRQELYPRFSGVICYEKVFTWQHGHAAGAKLSLGEAYETAQVFINGKDAGVRLAPPYDFSATGLMRPGCNHLKILVTNTLVHRQRDPLSMTLPMEPSGLIGPVTISWEE